MISENHLLHTEKQPEHIARSSKTLFESKSVCREILRLGVLPSPAIARALPELNGKGCECASLLCSVSCRRGAGQSCSLQHRRGSESRAVVLYREEQAASLVGVSCEPCLSAVLLPCGSIIALLSRLAALCHVDGCSVPATAAHLLSLRPGLQEIRAQPLSSYQRRCFPAGFLKITVSKSSSVC